VNKRYLITAAVGLCGVASLLVFSGTGTDTVTNYPSEGTTIVAFGDSLVAGVGATPRNDFVSVLSREIGKPIVNLGVAGDTTRDGLARIDAVLVEDPKVVLLLLGGNDYLQNIPQSETFANLATMIESIHESGAVVILLGVRGGILRDNYKAEYDRLANTYQTAYVPDVLGGLFGNTDLMSDPVHPNDAGYQIIADRVVPVLQEVTQDSPQS